MKGTRFALSVTFALIAAVALFAAGCATTGGTDTGKSAAEGYRYFCNCGPDCNCGSSDVKPGNCTCGKPMVQKKILAQHADSLYICGCPDCACDALNPKNPSQCSCEKPLKRVLKK